MDVKFSLNTFSTFLYLVALWSENYLPVIEPLGAENLVHLPEPDPPLPKVAIHELQKDII